MSDVENESPVDLDEPVSEEGAVDGDVVTAEPVSEEGAVDGDAVTAEPVSEEGAVDGDVVTAEPVSEEGPVDGDAVAAGDEPVLVVDADGPVEAEAAVAVADDVVAEEDLTDTPEEAEEDDPWTRPGEWFVVHTQSGYEKKVTANLHARIQSMNMEDKIFEVVIPMEEVVEFKGGRKQIVQRKVFPGYLLVRCYMDDESLVLHPQHAGRHRLRRPEPAGPEADAAVAQGGAHLPVGQG